MGIYLSCRWTALQRKDIMTVQHFTVKKDSVWNSCINSSDTILWTEVSSEMQKLLRTGWPLFSAVLMQIFPRSLTVYGPVVLLTEI